MAVEDVRLITLPAGKLFVAPYVSGVLRGERYLGETDGADMTVTPKTEDRYEPDGDSLRRADSFPVSADAVIAVKCIEARATPLDLGLMSGMASAAQSEATGSGETIAGVEQGCWYPVGVDGSHPAGIYGATAISVAGKTPGTDYEFEVNPARVYIVPGGGIADGSSITVTHSRPAASIARHTPRSDLSVGAVVALRHVPDPTRGRARALYVPRALAVPSGAVRLKRTAQGELQVVELRFLPLAPVTGGPAWYLDDVPALDR